MNTFKDISRLVLCLGLILAGQPVWAADTDIYSRSTDENVNVNLNPNILVVIDNSANWASASQHWPGGIKQGEAELNALRTVIGELGGNTNLGLMMFTAGSGTNPSGGYVRFHVRPMDATNKAAFSELIGYPSGCTDGANSLNGTPNCILKNFNASEKTGTAKVDLSATMLDVFKYFGGYTWPEHVRDGIAGANVNSSQFGTLRYAGDPDPKSDPKAFTDTNKTNYDSPLKDANNCAKNYVIYIGNGFPSQDSPSTLLGPKELLPTQSVGGDVTQLPLANLASSTTTQTTLVYQTACGEYPGASVTESTDACQVKAGGAVTIATGNPAVFTRANHGMVAGNVIQLTTDGQLPNGLALLTDYYVISSGLTTNTFSVSLAPGGAAVSASGTQSGTHNYTGFAKLYPGYSSYSCSYNTSCSAGSTSSKTTFLGASACGTYATATACESALAIAYPGYTSRTCTNQTACTASSANPDNPLANLSACIAAANEADCRTIAATMFPKYSGFSCSGKDGTGCSGNNNKWRIDATTKNTTGYTYNMNGITTTTVTGISYSQNITGTHTTLAATPTGTFSAPTTSEINYFDEWAKFLHKTDVSAATGQQNVSTFTIDVFKDQQDLNLTRLLMSAAEKGGGRYFQASDETGITNALRKIISEIQSVNSVFASSSLPVSVNTQGTYLNQVFMGMFRPEGNADPRWPGNLKQYKFAVINAKLQLADKNGMAAISTATGFITPCANSYWSTDTGTYWDYSAAQVLGDCTAVSSAYPSAGSPSLHSDAPDGEVVEKGGVAQRLRGVTLFGGKVKTSTNYAVCGTGTPYTKSCRKLLTCDGSTTTSCTTMTDFDDANTKVAAALTADLIWWTRGKDIDNENGNTDATVTPATAIIDEMRPSVHGGVVHSQPAVIDYGPSIGTIAFYGADDGVFHAIDGGQTDTEGIEIWGFVAPELYGKLNRLRTNSPRVAFPNISGSPAPTPKDYFFDGSIGTFQRNGSVWIYASMRRGGRAIYAFDVSDPYNPTIKWRKGCFTSDTTVDTSCTTGLTGDWTGIGQTWSHPTIVHLNGYMSGGLPKPVLIFGGGYDMCEDNHGLDGLTQSPACPTSGSTRKGNNIWFVDADTGKVLRTYPTLASVPGDLAVVKDAAGYLNFVYAADTAGNVYRINVGSTDGLTFSFWSDNTDATKIQIASLQETAHKRKFINGPNVVPSPGFNAVLIGSGDREHPLVSQYACNTMSSTAGTFVTNQFYMLMDQPLAYPGVWKTTDLVDVTAGVTTSVTASNTTTITNVTGGATTTSTIGWRFNLSPCEQVVNEGITLAGVTYFGTNTPSPGGTSCVANLGTARGYAVDYLTGNAVNASRYGVFVGGGMPPSPVAGVVDVDGTKYPFCIGCIDTDAANSSALQGSEVDINPTGSRFRTYWYLEND
jgi:Tfp pilus tip-associated adhesin PilY1